MFAGRRGRRLVQDPPPAVPRAARSHRSAVVEAGLPDADAARPGDTEAALAARGERMPPRAEASAARRRDAVPGRAPHGPPAMFAGHGG
ncbi:hypothetical protein [Streptomyces sp. NPDC059168]|uniref:hypothetical protein n=1 Tax=Streptomyces sp. NPDC059168 TaxID=3346753 RepID=UPI003699A950